MQGKTIGSLYQSGDWKNEKHVPVIEAPASVEAETPFEVTLSIGKEVPHPNTTEHHIRWIKLHFLPEGEKLIQEIGIGEFAVHGESADGTIEGPAYTEPYLTMRLKINKSGILLATSYCNIHGLWENSQPIRIA